MHFAAEKIVRGSLTHQIIFCFWSVYLHDTFLTTTTQQKKIKITGEENM